MSAKRGGDLIYMTMDELSKAEQRSGRHNLVTIGKHKNKSVKICYLNLRYSLFKAVNLYTQNIRPFAEPCVQNVFTTHDGKALEESASLMQAAWA